MGFARRFLDSFSSDVYIDLGTANTLVMDSRRGLVANEPSVVAFMKMGPGRRKIVAVGHEAKAKIGKTPGELVASHPLREGVIAELDTTLAMLKYFLSKRPSRFNFARPRMVISLPYGVSDVEKQAVRECGTAAGARDVVLIEEPMAAAIGSGLPIESAKGSMVIDIGGGTTEIAVISLYGIVVCEAVRVGGHAFDEAIVDYVRRRYNLTVGPASAERLKIQIGSALPGDVETVSQIRGVDFTTGLPREIQLTSHDVYEALAGQLNEIVTAARRALEKTPPELAADIVNSGVVLAGGGALLKGMDVRFAQELRLDVRISDDPLLAIARGGERAVRDPELLSRIAIG